MSGSTQLFYLNYDISHLKVSQGLIQLLMSKRGAVKCLFINHYVIDYHKLNAIHK